MTEHNIVRIKNYSLSFGIKKNSGFDLEKKIAMIDVLLFIKLFALDIHSGFQEK